MLNQFYLKGHGFCLVGIKGTYQGLTATMMKQGSNQAIRFFVVESLKDYYKGGDNKKTVPKLLTGCFGAIAGACSVLGNNPLDVVKTRMQVRHQANCTAVIDNNNWLPNFHVKPECLEMNVSTVVSVVHPWST